MLLGLNGSNADSEQNHFVGVVMLNTVLAATSVTISLWENAQCTSRNTVITRFSHYVKLANSSHYWQQGTMAGQLDKSHKVSEVY